MSEQSAREMPPVARIGDVMVVRVGQPRIEIHRLTLLTPESVAYANEVLRDSASGWKLEPAAAIGRAGGGS